MTKFNKEQLQAINFYKGACGVVASAGSGKSTVLIERIKKLVFEHHEIQSEILAISFTSKTAEELKKKLEANNLSKVNVGTFHSLCMRILLAEGIDVRGKLVPEWKAENWFKELDDKPDTKEILSFIGYQKSYMNSPTDKFAKVDTTSHNEREMKKFYQIYETRKKQEGMYDFDDYLLVALEVLRKNKGKYTFEFVLVDEHQDSNLVQNEILKEICQSGNIFVVGDVRQSIYSFRAGNIEYFINFEKYWNNATIINLFMNYRSTNNVVGKSNDFIRPYFSNYAHYVDSEASNKNMGTIESLSYQDDIDEAMGVVDKIEEMLESGVDPSSIAILYRLNANSMSIENELRSRDIEYDITNNSSFFKRKEVEAVICYLRLALDPHDEGALETIFKFRAYPMKFFSNAVFDGIRKYAKNNNVNMFDALSYYNYDKAWQAKSAKDFVRIVGNLHSQSEDGASVKSLIDNIIKMFKIDEYIKEKYKNDEEIKERVKSLEVLKSFVKNNNLEQFITFVYSAVTKKKTKDNVVKLMTIHASKGLEWDNVLMVGVEDGKFPHEMANEAEEARLFYVGATRPKKNLWVSQIGTGNKFVKQYFGKDK